MAASSSSISSSICTESEIKNHGFQIHKIPGPKGAYEARQVNGGFYVRVDMPGVPPDGVKIFKRGETHTVTFNGKAPRLWPDCENFDRIYGGYVVLDRNPNDIDVEMSVVNGSLRLFFPNADGLLHYFVPKKRGPPKHMGDEKECCHNKLVQYVATLDEATMLNPGLKNLELHPSGCSCCKDGYVIEDYTAFNYQASTHINPYLLDGIKGVVDSGAIVDETGERMYMRVDMPGVGEKNISTRVENGVTFVCEGRGSVEYPFDEGGRSYAIGLTLDCTCCKIADVKHEIRYGVFRVSIRRCTAPCISRKESNDCKIALLQWP